VNTTTIRAHPPVETPLGLVIALPTPPCVNGCDAPFAVCCSVCNSDATVDVFALAVPCPTCTPPHKGGSINWAGRLVPCHGCEGSGWVHHGDYRVLEVLPLVGDGYVAGDCDYIELVDGGEVELWRWDAELDDHRRTDLGDGILPGAVPGGCALVVAPSWERKT
jgi:hypothetical protein